MVGDIVALFFLFVMAIAIWGFICSMLDISYTQVSGKFITYLTPVDKRSKVEIVVAPNDRGNYSYYKFAWEVKVTLPDGRVKKTSGQCDKARVAKNKAKHAAYQIIKNNKVRETPELRREYKF